MSFTDTEHINFYRILSLTFEVSSRTLGSYLAQRASQKGFSNVSQFLSHFFHTLFFLWSKSPLCACGEQRKSHQRSSVTVLSKTQWNTLFQSVEVSGSKCLYIPRTGPDLEIMDVTLSSCILLNVCADELSQDIKNCLADFKKQSKRNSSSGSNQCPDVRFRLQRHLDSNRTCSYDCSQNITCFRIREDRHQRI